MCPYVRRSRAHGDGGGPDSENGGKSPRAFILWNGNLPEHFFFFFDGRWLGCPGQLTRVSTNSLPLVQLKKDHPHGD